MTFLRELIITNNSFIGAAFYLQKCKKKSVVAMVSVDVMWVTDRVHTGCLDMVGEMKKQGVPFNKDTFILAFATCYKLVKAA